MSAKKTRIDWKVLAFMEDEKNNRNPNATIEYRTSGFEKHGFGGEVVVIGKIKDSKKITNMINTFCRMLIEGEIFAPGYMHSIDNVKGKPQFVFGVHEYNNLILSGGVKYQLILR